VFIQGHDVDNSHVFADSATGFFTRFLKPQSWDLTFTAGGYHDTTITGVQVYDHETTYLEVRINPILNPADTIRRTSPYLYPNPASVYIKAVLPEHLQGGVNVKICNSSGKIISDFNYETMGGFPIRLDIRKLRKGSYIAVFTNIMSGQTGSCSFIVN